MTGPRDDDWGFPEVDQASPSPASVRLPEPEPEPEVVYDTGSDAWWRAQAEAQRAAAQLEPGAASPAEAITSRYGDLGPVDPTHVGEAEVLADPAWQLPTGPDPLDAAYLPQERPWQPVPEQPEHALADVAGQQWDDEQGPWIEQEPWPAAGWAPRGEQDQAEHEDWDEGEPQTAVPGPSLMRPRTVPQADDWYDAASADEAREDEGRRTRGGGVGRAVAWASLALAGVGLLVVALLLLGQGEPQGDPTVALPRGATSTEPATAPTPSPSPSPTATAAVPPEPSVSIAPTRPVAPRVSLAVLNNSRITGLADRSARRFRAAGWPVRETGNYTGKLEESTVYYPPGQRASAERFAREFGVRVLPHFDRLPTTGMTVVLTRDFA